MKFNVTYNRSREFEISKKCMLFLETINCQDKPELKIKMHRLRACAGISIDLYFNPSDLEKRLGISFEECFVDIAQDYEDGEVFIKEHFIPYATAEYPNIKVIY